MLCLRQLKDSIWNPVVIQLNQIYVPGPESRYLPGVEDLVNEGENKEV